MEIPSGSDSTVSSRTRTLLQSQSLDGGDTDGGESGSLESSLETQELALKLIRNSGIEIDVEA